MITFDTNVLVYAANQREPRKQDIALQLLNTRESAVLLWQVACEFIAASRKLTGHGFTSEEAWDLLAHHLRSFQLVLPSANVLNQGRALHVDHQWSYWDAMIVAAGIDAGVTLLYSEDLPGSKTPPGLEIVNPFK